MELRHLRYFIKSAELVHFTHAAVALHISQPTLSLQIQQLEQELGSQLFERAGRAVRLTEAGQCFLLYAQRALCEIEAGRQRVQDLNGLLRGTLRIGITYSVSAELVPSIVAEFVRSHPTIHVPVSIGTDCGIEKGVRAGELDVGMVYQSLKPSDLNALQLFKEDIVLVVSRKHRLARSTAVRVRDLLEVPLALPTPDFTTRHLIDAAFAAANIEPRVMVEANDIEFLVGLAKHGIAAAVVTARAAAHLHLQSTSRIRLSDKGLQLTAAIVWLRNGSISPTAARFIKLASSHLRKLAARHV